MADSSLIEIIDKSENEAFSDIFIEDDESIDEAEETITDIKVASPIISPIWKFFTRKEKIEKNQEGDEQLIKYIHCNIGECFLSANNSTTTSNVT
ncbi:uncharacterized protein OCT59_018463 [Rhizophagus irregularis]|uniref:uncharacterized protein n=1 Tax=Rhizophagus irregularis TaxID=588596 RepID=UPI0033201877|nr:hypothetical protein OCT59_018463 [Rhizophagus irregularis]